jgi:hypothetical protein
VPRRSPFKVALFLLVLAGVGAVAALSVRTNLPDLRSLSYERTEGVVTLSEVGPLLESGRYAWRFEYAYTVAGHQYTGTRFDPGRQPGFKSEQWGRSTVRSYPPGRHVTVYYDPADPAEAVLHRPTLARMLGGLWFLSGPALIALLGGWAFLLGGPPARFEPPAGGPPWVARLRPVLGFQAAGNVVVIVFLAGFVLVCLSGSVARPERDDGGEEAAAVIAIAAWMVYLGVIAACGWRGRVPARLVIDPTAGTLRYRPRWFWPPAVEVSQAAVQGTRLMEASEHRYVVRIEYDADGQAAVLDLPAYEDRAVAEALAAWVRSVLVAAQRP